MVQKTHDGAGVGPPPLRRATPPVCRPEVILERLLSIHGELRSSSWSHAHLSRVIATLEGLVFGCPDDVSDVAHQLPPGVTEDFNKAYCEWETQLEHLFAEGVLRGDMESYHRYPLCDRFGRLLSREVDLVSCKPRRTLFIGSGPFPISAIWLNKIAGTPTDCVDHNPEAVECSRRTLRALSLSDVIRVHLGDGETVDLADYDLILIALLAKPKQRILEHIHRAARPDCRVICRTSHGLRTLLYQPTDLDQDVKTRFQVTGEAIVRGEQPDTISSIALRRAAS